MEDLGSEKGGEERWRVSCIVIFHMLFLKMGSFWGCEGICISGVEKGKWIRGCE